MMPYLSADGEKHGEIPEFKVPKKIRLMSTYISKQLKENPNEQIIELEITPFFLKLITEYCASFGYLKVRSTIQFPAEYNNF